VKSEELPPKPTWTDALSAIASRNPRIARDLKRQRKSLAQAFNGDVSRLGWNGAIVLHTWCIARLESEALDLFEKLRQDGDRSTVAALESREVESREPDPV